jgi:hypothetical protein
MDSRPSIRLATRLLVPFLALVSWTGCSCSGDRPQVVRGTVSLDGAPLPYGVVQFHGPAGRLVTAVIGSDGTFTATEVPPGEVRVAVVEDIMAMPAKGADTKAGKKRAQVPTRYKDVQTSGLNYTITRATRNLDIVLTSK